MSLSYLLRNGIQSQIDIIHSVTKAIIKPPARNHVGQVLSLFNVLGTISKKKAIIQSQKDFKPVALPIPKSGSPVESIKGVGKKLGAKLRAFGLSSTADLKAANPHAYKIPGISQARLQQWQASL